MIVLNFSEEQCAPGMLKATDMSPQVDLEEALMHYFQRVEPCSHVLSEAGVRIKPPAPVALKPPSHVLLPAI